MGKVLSVFVDDKTYNLLAAEAATQKMPLSQFMRGRCNKIAEHIAKNRGEDFAPAEIKQRYVLSAVAERRADKPVGVSTMLPAPVYMAMRQRMEIDGVSLGTLLRTICVRAMGFGVAKCEDLRSPASKAAYTQAANKLAVKEAVALCAKEAGAPPPAAPRPDPANRARLPDYPDDMPNASAARSAGLPDAGQLSFDVSTLPPDLAQALAELDKMNGS